jgi:hypothetical protein
MTSTAAPNFFIVTNPPPNDGRCGQPEHQPLQISTQQLRPRPTQARAFSIGSIKLASSSLARALFTRFDTDHFCNTSSFGRFHRSSSIICVTEFPLLEVFRLEDERLSVMHLGQELVWLRDDHRAGQKVVASLSILPTRPAIESGLNDKVQIVLDDLTNDVAWALPNFASVCM